MIWLYPITIQRNYDTTWVELDYYTLDNFLYDKLNI